MRVEDKGVSRKPLMPAATFTATPSIDAADQLVSELLSHKPELIGIEDCEELCDRISYTFESGHWAEVFAVEHGGLTHRLHQPEEE